MSNLNSLRPVRIENVAVYDGKLGWFHTFGTRSFTSKKTGGVTYELVGIIELENGKLIQLSTNRFVFLDPKKVTDIFALPEFVGESDEAKEE